MTHPFTSTLARDLQDFLAFKQALGHPYRRAVFTLRSFDRYVYAQVSRTRRLPFERCPVQYPRRVRPLFWTGAFPFSRQANN